MEKQGPPQDTPPAYGQGGGGQNAPLYPNPGEPQYQGPPPTHTQNVPVTVVTMSSLSTNPMAMQCPQCHAQITTVTTPVSGLLVWLCVGGLFLVGCVLGCCLIPLCIDDLKDVEHRCPQCQAFIGIKKRL